MAGTVPALSVHIRDVTDVVPICEKHLRGVCQHGDQCDYHHNNVPYLWQLNLPNSGWQSIGLDSQDVESSYCKLLDYYRMETMLNAADGISHPTTIEFDLSTFQARLTSPSMSLTHFVVDVRRLSTPSYVQTVEKYGMDAVDIKFHTQWRWYWRTQDGWKLFNEDNLSPAQFTLESKYLDQQQIYRFIINEASLSKSSKEMVFLLNFPQMQLSCLNDNNIWKVGRRPVFISGIDVQQNKCTSSPPTKLCPFMPTLPDHWSPIDTSQQFELVPLSPETMGYHLVASEFHQTLPQHHKIILDIYRVQNPLLWHQYSLKKTFMESRRPGSTCCENQLFHGTSEDSVVQAICRDNFDWRVCGKNNTIYGKGSYFAKHAQYSDKYASINRTGSFVKWMFLARVLVGHYTKGRNTDVRPPPIDEAFPHGELYDSCVDIKKSPTIFVVFDKDQSYPEYLISYR